MDDRSGDLGWILIHQSQQARADLEDAIRRSRQSILQARRMLRELPRQQQQGRARHLQGTQMEVSPADAI